MAYIGCCAVLLMLVSSVSTQADPAPLQTSQVCICPGKLIHTVSCPTNTPHRYIVITEAFLQYETDYRKPTNPVLCRNCSLEPGESPCKVPYSSVDLEAVGAACNTQTSCTRPVPVTGPEPDHCESDDDLLAVMSVINFRCITVEEGKAKGTGDNNVVVIVVPLVCIILLLSVALICLILYKRRKKSPPYHVTTAELPKLSGQTHQVTTEDEYNTIPADYGFPPTHGTSDSTNKGNPISDITDDTGYTTVVLVVEDQYNKTPYSSNTPATPTQQSGHLNTYDKSSDVCGDYNKLDSGVKTPVVNMDYDHIRSNHQSYAHLQARPNNLQSSLEDLNYDHMRIPKHHDSVEDDVDVNQSFQNECVPGDGLLEEHTNSRTSDRETGGTGEGSNKQRRGDSYEEPDIQTKKLSDTDIDRSYALHTADTDINISAYSSAVEPLSGGASRGDYEKAVSINNTSRQTNDTTCNNDTSVVNSSDSNGYETAVLRPSRNIGKQKGVLVDTSDTMGPSDSDTHADTVNYAQPVMLPTVKPAKCLHGAHTESTVTDGTSSSSDSESECDISVDENDSNSTYETAVLNDAPVNITRGDGYETAVIK